MTRPKSAGEHLADLVAEAHATPADKRTPRQRDLVRYHATVSLAPRFSDVSPPSANVFREGR